MIPKEKAIELVTKFIEYVDENPIEDEDYEKENAKKCALIAVDEVTKLYHNGVNEFVYWQQVKTEIQSL